MRIIWSLVALVIGIGVGFWVVQHFQLVSLLKTPIAPYLANGGKLTVLSPTEPVMIVFKLSLVVGLVLASPVVFWQVWAFLAPALYGREKRVLVPALFAGAGLFMLGGVLAWIFVGGRLLHSAVQILTTNIRLRGLVFMVNFLAVLGLWAIVLAQAA